MQKKNAVEFATIMAGLAENFGATLSAPGIAMRFEALREFSLEQVKAATQAILRSRKYLKMPTVAEFVEHIEGGNVEDIGLVEASKALAAIKRHGSYRSVVFDNAITMAVVEHGFGGWVKMCQELNADEEKWFVKDFAKTYGAYSRQGVKLFGHLAGTAEITNNANQLHNFIRQPELCGDTAKALEVLNGNGLAIEEKAQSAMPSALAGTLCGGKRVPRGYDEVEQ